MGPAIALRRLAGNTTNHLLRSLSTAPAATRSALTNNNNSPPPQIPPSHSPPHHPFSRPTFSPNVFDPLASPTRSMGQRQLMNQSVDNSFSSVSRTMGVSGANMRVDVRNALHLNMFKVGSFKTEMTRSFSSTAESAPDQLKNDEKVQPKILRPLSPHLPIYKPQLNSAASIFNRISGSYLTVVVCVFYLLCLKLGLVCFTYYPFYQLLFYSSKLMFISVELAAIALAYHVFHGLRHLKADFSGGLGGKFK